MLVIRQMSNDILTAIIGHCLCDNMELTLIFQVTVIENKGELHIVTKDMPNDGRKNVIGHLPEYEHVLLDYIEPWKVFAFRIV